MVHRACGGDALRMNAIYEHPSLKMHVTTEQRDRAESWLKEAYADGRISELEFDQRIGQVLTAVTRKELNEAFYGLNAREVLNGGVNSTPNAVQIYPQTLARY